MTDFLQLVCQNVRKHFVSGYELNKQFKLALASTNYEKHPSGRMVRNLQKNKNVHFYQWMDVEFPTWNANRISNTHFIVGEGPVCSFSDTFFKTVMNHNIHHVVALGQVMAYHDSTYQDFFDYAIKDRINQLDENEQKIQWSSKRKQGKVYVTSNGYQCNIDGIIESEITISNTKTNNANSTYTLHVTTLSVSDNQAFMIGDVTEKWWWEISNNTTDDGKMIMIQTANQQRHILWNLYQLSKTTDVLVHCSAGCGRSGYFVMMMLLLDKHQEWYCTFPENEKEKEEEAAQNASTYILNLLQHTRQYRQSFITTEQQLMMAIHHAHDLYEYSCLFALYV